MVGLRALMQELLDAYPDDDPDDPVIARRVGLAALQLLDGEAEDQELVLQLDGVTFTVKQAQAIQGALAVSSEAPMVVVMHNPDGSAPAAVKGVQAVTLIGRKP
jgi:hypothetical protein